MNEDRFVASRAQEIAEHMFKKMLHPTPKLVWTGLIITLGGYNGSVVSTGSEGFEYFRCKELKVGDATIIMSLNYVSI